MLAFHTYQNYLGPKIRGKEIAEYLNAIYTHKYSQTRERGDVNIHIKPKSLEGIPDGDWVDITDGEWVVPLLKERPKVNAIAGSLYNYNLFKYLPNKMVWISQQHINWDREKKENRGKVCGYIGGPTQHIRDVYKEVEEEVRKIGYDFIACFDFVDRKDAINFYKKIDILLVMDSKEDHIYKTPTKLINAASFGIPSIAYPLKGYEEWKNYIPARSMEEMIEAIKNLKFSPEELINTAEYYHISNVAKRYEELDDLHRG